MVHGRTFEGYVISQPPKNTFTLEIIGGVIFYSNKKPPNVFHRFMMNKLLGWKFELLDEK